jgi:pimeloyl-ACP methyl ester carboxylesterase
VLAVAGLLLGVAGTLGAAWWLTKSWPSPVGALPRDLHGETVEIPWPRGVMRAWMLEGDGVSGAIVLLHGWRGCRRWMLDRARFLLDQGFSVIAPDLPGHGESPADSVTFGLTEGAAVDAVLDCAQRRFPGQPLGVIGLSLGGASFLMARRDVRVQAVILESVFPTLRQALVDRMHRFLGPVGSLLTPGLVAAVALLRGQSPDSVRPIDRVASLGCPLLAMHGARDLSTPVAEVEEWFARAVPPKELWILDGAEHEDLYAAGGAEYRRRVLAFLARCLKRTG